MPRIATALPAPAGAARFARPRRTLAAVAAAACLALLPAHPVLAAEPTTETVEKLLVVTKSQVLVEQMYGYFEGAMRAGMQQALGGQRLTDKQQAVLDRAPAEFAAVLRQELSWDKIRPIQVGIYRETFTQDEINGLIAFYESPVGKAFVDKMPAVMQRSNQLMQVLAAPMAEKMRAAMERAVAEARSPG